MSYYKKGTPIGHQDFLGNEICAGDVCMTDAGKRLTIDEQGRALDSNGKVVIVKDFTVLTVINGAAADFSARPKPAPRSGNPGGRPNKTGLTQIANISVRHYGVSGAEASKVAEDAGMVVVCRKGKACITTDDLPRFKELLREKYSNPRKAEPVVDVPLPPAPVPEPDPMPIPVEYDKDGRHYVDFTGRPLQELIPEESPRTLSKADAFLILTDQDLADELRRRGFEVCAVKHIQL